MKRFSIAIVAFVALFALGSVAASAATNTKTYDSKVTIDFVNDKDGVYGEGDKFKGHVSSKKKKCESNRKVSVYRNDDDTLVGRDETNDNGNYKVSSPDTQPGKYYAKVKKFEYENNKGKTVVCQKMFRTTSRSSSVAF